MTLRQGSEAERVLVFDTTLRDGEQAPGFSLTVDKRRKMAIALEKLRVDIIEVGFPASSVEAEESCRQLATMLTGPTVAVLARARLDDVRACERVLANTSKPRVHVFAPTSDLHIVRKLRTSRSGNLLAAVSAVTAATSFADVQFACEDATRADVNYLSEIVVACVEAGAKTINLADTVGYAVPDEFGNLVGEVVRLVASKGVTVSVHCHDDLGLAVANSLAGLQAGARQVECTVNGIGERAGNASLEEIVMSLSVRKDVFGLDCGVDTKLLLPTSELLVSLTGEPIARNKAIVGRNAFAHEAGIHQHGIFVDPATYEVMPPTSVGAAGSSIVLGKHSGLYGLRHCLKRLGMDVPKEHLRTLLRKCKEAAVSGPIGDDQLIVLARQFLFPPGS